MPLFDITKSRRVTTVFPWPITTPLASCWLYPITTWVLLSLNVHRVTVSRKLKLSIMVCFFCKAIKQTAQSADFLTFSFYGLIRPARLPVQNKRIDVKIKTTQLLLKQN